MRAITDAREAGRDEFDSLISDALDALGKVIDDGDVGEFWTAHAALSRALGLLLDNRWDVE